MLTKILFFFCIAIPGFSFEGNGKSFEFINLGLTTDESENLKHLNIENTAKFDQFGNLDEIEEQLTDFINSVGYNDPEVIKNATDVISRLARQVKASAGKNSAWVSVRASTADASFSTPRWHIDGADYGLGNVALYPTLTHKFAATLKGPSTHLYDLSVEQRDIFLSNFNDRLFLSQFLNINDAESASPGQGVFFIIGDREKGTIHSEPMFNESRLFFSVVAGDEAEIEDLYSRRTIQAEKNQSWEESHIFDRTPKHPEPPAYWVKKCEDELVILKVRIDDFILQQHKASDLIELIKTQSAMPNLSKFYIKMYNQAIKGGEIEWLFTKLDFEIPSANVYGGNAPIVTKYFELEAMTSVLHQRNGELEDLIKDLEELLKR
jgi:hypothetical protein